MKFYPENSRNPIRADAPHDPDALLFYGFKYQPEVWAANTVYNKEKQIVMPSVFNGFEYYVDSNGISGSTEPTWPTEAGETVTDGTVRFKAVEYKEFLQEGETLTASEWTATEDVPVTNQSNTDNETQAMFGPVPTGVNSFVIKNHVTKNNSEQDDRSMIINVSDR